MGLRFFASGRTLGLGYHLSLTHGLPPRGQKSHLTLELHQYPPILERQLREWDSVPPCKEPHRDEFDSDEAWEAALQREYEEWEEQYGPIRKKRREAETRIKTIRIDIGLGGVSKRVRGDKTWDGKGWNNIRRKAARSRRGEREPPGPFERKSLWIDPGKTPPKDIQFLLALYLWQENIIELKNDQIYGIFANYLKAFHITETLPDFLGCLRKNYDLPQDWRGLRDYIGKARQGYPPKKNMREVGVDLEETEKRRVQKERGLHGSRIPREEPELLSVYAAVSLLEGKISRDTIDIAICF